MKHLFKPKVFKNILTLLIVLLLGKLLWFTIEVLWLPTKGITHVSKSGTKPLYYRVKLSSNQAPTQIVKQHVTRVDDLKNVKLIAIYHALANTVVTVIYKSKTKVLQRGEEINGYMLRNAGNNFANFSKNGKMHKILLNTGKSASKYTKSIAVKKNISSPIKKKGTTSKGIIDMGTHKKVSRSLIKKYTSNMNQLYKDININEVKTAEGIDGFRVNFIRKNSDFSKLGIEKGDVIKSINGQAINSYEAAFQLYQNMENIDNLSMVVKRGKEEKELEYEIN